MKTAIPSLLQSDSWTPKSEIPARPGVHLSRGHVTGVCHRGVSPGCICHGGVSPGCVTGAYLSRGHVTGVCHRGASPGCICHGGVPPGCVTQSSSQGTRRQHVLHQTTCKAEVLLAIWKQSAVLSKVLSAVSPACMVFVRSCWDQRSARNCKHGKPQLGEVGRPIWPRLAITKRWTGSLDTHHRAAQSDGCCHIELPVSTLK